MEKIKDTPKHVCAICGQLHFKKNIINLSQQTMETYGLVLLRMK
jgi:rRNA maturation endonuclease Nob1